MAGNGKAPPDFAFEAGMSPWKERSGSGEPVENVHQFLQASLAFFTALFHACRDAVLHVRTKHRQTDAIKRGLGRRELLKDLYAEAGLLHHPPDTAHLPLNPIESGHQKLLLGRV